MNKSITIKKSATLLIALSAFLTFAFFAFSTNAYAMDMPHIVDYSEVCAAYEGDPMSNGLIFDDDDWYDTYIQAWIHAKYSVGQHVEFKHIWIIFYGWTTKGCTVTDVACTENKGKYAPIYKNSYNNNYYLGSAYE